MSDRDSLIKSNPESARNTHYNNIDSKNIDEEIIIKTNNNVNLNNKNDHIQSNKGLESISEKVEDSASKKGNEKDNLVFKSDNDGKSGVDLINNYSDKQNVDSKLKITNSKDNVTESLVYDNEKMINQDLSMKNLIVSNTNEIDLKIESIKLADGINSNEEIIELN